jgi:polyhydroxyalkanoate synthesis regulator phasin
MRRRIIIFVAALLIAPGFSAAQTYGDGQGQHKTKSSMMQTGMGMMQSNMGMLADITAKMSDMMGKGQMNPEQQKQILDMMNQMSRIMREMSVPHGDQVKKRHNEALNEMRQRIDSLEERVGD